jgi:hypothetical protein
MIFEIEDKKYDMSWEPFDEKISSLKRKKTIKIQIPLNLQRIDHSSAFDYFKSLTTIDKVKVSKNNYSWVFLNCTIDKIHLAPTKWNDPYSALGDNKIVTIDIIFEDVIGSHNDELLKGKLRDKKLNELLKQSDK